MILLQLMQPILRLTSLKIIVAPQTDATEAEYEECSSILYGLRKAAACSRGQRMISTI